MSAPVSRSDSPMLSTSVRPGASRTPTARAIAAGIELRVRDRREPDEVDGAVHGRRARDLEREAALAGAAGPGDASPAAPRGV